MKHAKAKRSSLIAAGALSVGMGTFHLFLPQVFGWANGMRDAPSSLQWALSSLNVFWSLLILLTGVLVVVLTRGSWSELPPCRAILSTLACYWLMHTAYLLVFPFPLPADLAWLGRAFIAYAAAQAVLHGWPVVWQHLTTPHTRATPCPSSRKSDALQV